MALTSRHVFRDADYRVGVIPVTDYQGTPCDLQGMCLVDSTGAIISSLITTPLLLTYTHTRPSFTSGASSVVIAANTARKELQIINNTSQMFFLEIGAAAVLNQGLRLTPGTTWVLHSTQEFRAIFTNSGTANLDVYEGV